MADFKVSAERVELFDHPNAERLQVAKVGMFSLVVQKGLYEDGDIVVFAPKRAILPEDIRENYKNEETGLSYLRRGAIVRSIRLRGELSEGVLLDKRWVMNRVACQQDMCATLTWGNDNEVLGQLIGSDISAVLEIVEDVPELPKQFLGVAANIRAQRFSQHDVEGIRIHSREFTEGETVIVSEKLHGSQINILFHEDGFVEIGSKGLLKKGVVLEESASNLYWQAFNAVGLREIVAELWSGKFVQIMGEVIPAQKGFSYGHETPTLRIFRLEVCGVRVGPAALKNIQSVVGAHGIWASFLDLWVPFKEMPFDLAVIETLAKGKEGISGRQLHIKEGVVVEPYTPRTAKRGSWPLYLKVINPKFKEDDDEALS